MTYQAQVGIDARTRNGGRVAIMRNTGEGTYPVKGNRYPSGTYESWTPEGKYEHDQSDSGFDLVGPWVEEVGTADGANSIAAIDVDTTPAGIDWNKVRIGDVLHHRAARILDFVGSNRVRFVYVGEPLAPEYEAKLERFVRHEPVAAAVGDHVMIGAVRYEVRAIIDDEWSCFQKVEEFPLASGGYARSGSPFMNRIGNITSIVLRAR